MMRTEGEQYAARPRISKCIPRDGTSIDQMPRRAGGAEGFPFDLHADIYMHADSLSHLPTHAVRGVTADVRSRCRCWP